MKKQGHDRTAIAERARAARRAAQLRREAEERAEVERKRDDGEPLTVNDMLAMLGSTFRLPEEEPLNPLELLAGAWEEGLLETDHAREVAKFVKEKTTPHDSPSKQRKQRATKAEDYTFTAEEITKLRDEVGLSWRQVAVNLDLGSPGAARKAYMTLTGRHYKDSVMTGRRTRTTMGSAKVSTRKVFAPDWNDDADQDEIIEKLTGSRVIVERDIKGIRLEEDLIVGQVRRLSWDGPEEDGPLTVHFVERSSGGMRSVRVQDIKEVR